jgi:hypothetical protein
MWILTPAADRVVPPKAKTIENEQCFREIREIRGTLFDVAMALDLD